MKVASMFAGVGGICSGFKNLGCNIVWANDFDKNASITYRENFGNSYFIEGDVSKIYDYPKCDILTAGFPCQSFSIAGYRKGFSDVRGILFFDVLRFISNIKPSCFLLENVKNLISHDNKKTFQIIIESLKEEGYFIKYKVLNSCEYGDVPQNRERIYMIGFLNKEKSDMFNFPERVPLTKTVFDIIKKDIKQEEKFYYKNGKFYEMLTENIKNTNSVYQIRRIYIRENKNNICPTLTANMGEGGHNVPIIVDNFGIRKITPRECFSLQGFPETFVLPKISNSSLYKQAGNSVTIPVIQKIAGKILEVL